MSKDTNKKRYDAKKALAIKNVAAEFGVTDSYVRIALNAGSMKSETATAICKRYNELKTKLDHILN
jgi:hypothetical protein